MDDMDDSSSSSSDGSSYDEVTVTSEEERLLRHMGEEEVSVIHGNVEVDYIEEVIDSSSEMGDDASSEGDIEDILEEAEREGDEDSMDDDSDSEEEEAEIVAIKKHSVMARAMESRGRLKKHGRRTFIIESKSSELEEKAALVLDSEQKLTVSAEEDEEEDTQEEEVEEEEKKEEEKTEEEKTEDGDEKEGEKMTPRSKMASPNNTETKVEKEPEEAKERDSEASTTIDDVRAMIAKVQATNEFLYAPNLESTRSSSGMDSFLEDEESLAGDAALTWKGSAEETFSDCTLIVATKETETSKTSTKETVYHVHRAMLGASERRCEYFNRLQRENPKESTIRIYVQYKEAQEAFPVLLDYIYFGNLNICTRNSEALRHLAEALHCRPLKTLVNKFIKNDFGVDTAIHYVRETFKFRDQVLLEVAVRETAKLFSLLPNEEFAVLEPHLFCSIIMNPFLTTENGTEKVSKAILLYFDCNPAALQATLLVNLTSVIKEITKEDGPSFLKLVKSIDPEEDSVGWKQLTHLCIRCANAQVSDEWVSEDWGNALVEFFDHGQWAGDGVSRLLITRLVADLTFAQKQNQKQQDWMKKMAVQIDSNERRISKLKDDKDRMKREQIKVIKAPPPIPIITTSVHSVGDDSSIGDARDGPPHGPIAVSRPNSRPGSRSSSPARYNEVCRDVAISLGKQVHQKDRKIENLLGEMGTKTKELGKMKMMMSQLNARLKFYEATTSTPYPGDSLQKPAHSFASSSYAASSSDAGDESLFSAPTVE